MLCAGHIQKDGQSYLYRSGRSAAFTLPPVGKQHESLSRTYGNKTINTNFCRGKITLYVGKLYVCIVLQRHNHFNISHHISAGCCFISYQAYIWRDARC